MNLTTWNPTAVIVVIVVATVFGIPALTYSVIAILNAYKGNTQAAQQAADSLRGLAQQAALDALQKTGLPRQVTELGSQMQQMALATPPPPQSPTVAVITPAVEKP